MWTTRVACQDRSERHSGENIPAAQENNGEQDQRIL